MNAFTPYQPRAASFLGVETHAGYRLKVYSIRYGDKPFDRAGLNAAWPLGSAELPQPTVARGRPGVGFAVLHQGKTGDYFVLCWWDHENELPIRVFVREGGAWRAAQGGESICIWDLRIIWGEREAYVRTVLAENSNGIESYLESVVTGDA